MSSSYLGRPQACVLCSSACRHICCQYLLQSAFLFVPITIQEPLEDHATKVTGARRLGHVRVVTTEVHHAYVRVQAFLARLDPLAAQFARLLLQQRSTRRTVRTSAPKDTRVKHMVSSEYTQQYV